MTLRHAIRVVIDQTGSVRPEFTCAAPETDRCRIDGKCHAVLSFENSTGFECYEPLDCDDTELRSGVIAVELREEWTWRYPTADEAPSGPNPLNEVGFLRVRLDALTRESEGLYREGLRLARVSDRQEADLHRLKASEPVELEAVFEHCAGCPGDHPTTPEPDPSAAVRDERAVGLRCFRCRGTWFGESCVHCGFEVAESVPAGGEVLNRPADHA